MRRLDHQNVVQLLYFFFISSSDRVSWISRRHRRAILDNKELKPISCLLKSFSSAERRFICIWFWNSYLRLSTKLLDTTLKQNKRYPCSTLKWVLELSEISRLKLNLTLHIFFSILFSYLCINYSEVLHIFTQWESVIETSSLRTCCWTQRRLFWNCAISEGESNLREVVDLWII